MEYLIITLFRQEMLSKVIRALKDIDLLSITVSDSETMGQFIGENIDAEDEGMVEPVNSKSRVSKTVTAIVHNGTAARDIVRRLSKEGVHFERNEDGFLLTLPVHEYTGALQQEEIWS